jgi:hypothetical protein
MGVSPGEAEKGTLRLDFDRCLMLQFCGSAITTDAGLLAYRKLDDTLELTDKSAGTLAEARTRKKSSPSVGPVRCANRVRAAGRLRGRKMPQRGCAAIRRCAGCSATGRLPTLPLRLARWVSSRTRQLSRPENRAALADLPGQWIDKVHQRR